MKVKATPLAKENVGLEEILEFLREFSQEKCLVSGGYSSGKRKVNVKR